MSDPSITGFDEPSEDQFLDVLEASETLAELPDAARVEAWVSSALGVWAEAPDAAEIDQEFATFVSGSSHDHAPLLVVGLSRLVAVEAGAVDSAQSSLESTTAPAWVHTSPSLTATRAWSVRQHDITSIGLGFELGDGSQYSLLADIVDSILDSLIVAPGPDELFDGSEDLIEPDFLAVGDAAERMVEAWTVLRDAYARGQSHIPETIYVNGALARRCLAVVLDRGCAELFRVPSEVLPPEREVDAVDPAERAELNAWALALLDGVRIGPGSVGRPELSDPLLSARVGTYPAAEREAFQALEWADWLGVVIGLSRRPAGTVVEPGMLIDEINRCPEVTSTIPKKDRPYYEWAFSMVLPLWLRSGVLTSDNRLTPEGADLLVGALRSAWAPAS